MSERPVYIEDLRILIDQNLIHTSRKPKSWQHILDDIFLEYRKMYGMPNKLIRGLIIQIFIESLDFFNVPSQNERSFDITLSWRKTTITSPGLKLSHQTGVC